jgi:hypothetical protein
MSLLDSLLPGNRRILVNGIGVARGRDTLEIECIGATISDNPGLQRTRVALPASGAGPTEWAAFTPVVKASGGGFAIGNGDFNAQWRQTSTDHIEIAFHLNVGSTTNFGAGSLQVDFQSALVPEFEIDTAKLAGGVIPFYSVELRDSSTPANNRGGRVNYFDSHTLMVLPYGVAGQLTATVPFTWANGDAIHFAISVPAALVIS